MLHQCVSPIEVANLLRSAVRATDRIYRFGGEEFVLVAEGASLNKAAALSEKIRLKVENSQLLDKKTITISLGVAELGQYSSAEEWLAKADDALYQAKRNGRNQYCLATADSMIIEVVEKRSSPKSKKTRNGVTA